MAPSRTAQVSPFGKLVDKTLKKKGLSINDTPLPVHMSSSLMCDIRMGRKLPGPDMLVRYITALDLDEEETDIFVKLVSKERNKRFHEKVNELLIERNENILMRGQ